MELTNIKASARTTDRLTYVREELDSLSPSSSFDETIVALIEVAETNSELDVPDSATEDGDDFLP